MYKHFLYIVLTFFIFTGTIFSQDSVNTTLSDSSRIKMLEKKVEALEKKFEKDELEKLLQEAENTSDKKEEISKTKIFKSGQRALQAINPEMSFTGDSYFQYNFNDSPDQNRAAANFRVLALHVQAGLDPFSMAKAAIEFTPEGVELGEAYLTWTNFLPKISLTAGKFRQQFGVLNRWHKHALDQFDFPLPIQTIFGEEGLNQLGFSFNWFMPAIIGDANNLIVEVTNAQNENLFAGETFSFPSTLVHLKNYWDISRDTYLELGITGMFGKNKIPVYDLEGSLIDENSFNTWLGGADLTIFWEPVNKALYKSFLWRSEIYYANKEISQSNDIKSFGGYSYIEYKFAEQWQVGTRFDYSEPFQLNNSSMYTYQIIPYVTWWQSHWVKMRLQYNHLDGNVLPESSGTIKLQMVWAVGPHKHDRY